MQTRVQIGIVDEHQIYRKAIKTIVEKDEKFELAMEAENRLDFIGKLSCQISLVFIDIEMLLKDQFNLVRQARLKNKDVKIVALSLNTDEQYFGQLINKGVNGILTKHTSRRELVRAIDSVLGGEIYISETYNKTLVDNIIKIEKMEAKKVLLVDDDIDIITVAKAILKKEGFEVYTASNKVEGLKKAKEIMPDVAILDVMMTTYYEGFELAKGFKDDEDLKKNPGYNPVFYRCINL